MVRCISGMALIHFNSHRRVCTETHMYLTAPSASTRHMQQWTTCALPAHTHLQRDVVGAHGAGRGDGDAVGGAARAGHQGGGRAAGRAIYEDLQQQQAPARRRSDRPRRHAPPTSTGTAETALQELHVGRSMPWACWLVVRSP